MNTLTTMQQQSAARRRRLWLAVVCLSLFVVGCQSTSSGIKPNGDESLTGDGEDPLERKYREALDDEDNLLSPPSQPLVVESTPSGGKLRRATIDVPSDFNWVQNNTASLTEMQSYVHNTFARRDPNEPHRWIPELAYKVSVTEDHKTFTVHLREGVRWHVPETAAEHPDSAWLSTPRELTAEDAAFFFELMLDPKVDKGALGNYFRDLDSVEVLDQYTFRVRWKRKIQHAQTFTLGYFPLPKWLFERKRNGDRLAEDDVHAAFSTHWAHELGVGTGPYRIETFEPNRQLHLERHADYWNVAAPIETLAFELLQDPETAFPRLEAGELDFTSITPAHYRSEVVAAKTGSPFDSDELRHQVVDQPIYYYLGWNADKTLFSDKRVRRAMTLALDRDRMIEKVLHDLAKPIAGPMLPAHPGNAPEIEPLAYDLDKASSLLEEAGWQDTDDDGVLDKEVDGERVDFEFVMLAYNLPVTRSYMAFYREALRKIGVVMEPEFISWTLMQKKMDERNFDAFTGGWALGWDVDPYQLWHSSQADVPKGSNRVGFRNVRADEIIEELRVTFDQERRTELLRDFHRVIHDEQPYTFLYQVRQAYAWRAELKNVQFQQLRPVDFSLPWYFEQSRAIAGGDASRTTEN